MYQRRMCMYCLCVCMHACMYVCARGLYWVFLSVAGSTAFFGVMRLAWIHTFDMVIVVQSNFSINEQHIQLLRKP